MNHILKDGNTYRIGACLTVAELAESEFIQKDLSALAQGAKNLGTLRGLTSN